MNSIKKPNLYSNYYLKVYLSSLLSIVYAFLLSSIPNYLFRDREEYVVYAIYSTNLLEEYDSLSYIFNEPLFLYYNKILSYIFSVDFIPKVGVFFISFTLMYFILIYSTSMFKVLLGSLLIFFVSYTFHLQLVVLRQGIATAFFMWFVYFFWDQRKFYPLCFLLPFFHSSFFIIIFLLIYNDLLSYFIEGVKKRLFLITLTLSTSSFILLEFAQNLGLRQASQSHLLENNNSGGGLLLFSFALLILFFRGLNNVYQDKYGRIAVLGIIVYISFYYTVPVSGRIISTFLPFMYVYIVSSKNWKIIILANIFLIVHLFLFRSSISGGSLTLEGVRYLNNIFLF